MAKELSKGIAENLAFDVIQGYFNDQELCLRYDMTLGQLKAIRAQRSFRKLALDIKRDLEDNGERFKLKARRMSLGALKTLKELHSNPGMSGSTRYKAAMGVAELAGERKTAAPDQGVPRMVINTNLTLSDGRDNKGVYSISIDTAQLPDNSAADLIGDFHEDASDLL